MATQTVILTPTEDADNSDEVTVGSTPVTIVVYADDGVISEALRCVVSRKIGSNFQPMPGESGILALTKARAEVTLYAPGVYRVNKPATAEAVGFIKDEV